VLESRPTQSIKQWGHDLDAERWRQVDKILQDVLAKEPQERAAFLAEVYADDLSLKSEVEALMAAYERSGDFLEAALWDRSSVGSAELLEPHGKSFFGRFDKT
jgi:hypothetical protein